MSKKGSLKRRLRAAQRVNRRLLAELRDAREAHEQTLQALAIRNAELSILYDASILRASDGDQ